ncbi:MAG: aminotransferase class I/II-fold pyridoxal phosphate-dependent enzyme [Nitrospiraceae bacterium]|nr:aminotransferase class I/II-fold pyridoxal phosphate-dependent enzyme [Nitrospiraceae bacterium]
MKDRYTAAREFKMKEERMIDVSAGICPLGPSRKVRAAIRKAVRGVGTSADIAVRRLERLFLSKFGIPADRVLFASSLRELTGLLLSVLDAKKVVIAGGFKGLYGEDTAGTAMEVNYFNAGEDSGFVLDLDRLMQAAGGADLLIVANPDRVTGKLIDEGVFSRLRDLADRRGLRLAVDESLIEFSGIGIGPACGGKENIVTLRTTANYYGLPGLELAYAVSGHETVAKMRRRKCSGLNTLSVEAARAAFKDAMYRKQVEHFLLEEKRSLSRALEKAGGVTFLGSDSNVYLLKLLKRPEQFAAALARAGFFVQDCSAVDGFGEAFLRMSVLGHDKNVKLARLMRSLIAPQGTGSMDKDADDK